MSQWAREKRVFLEENERRARTGTQIFVSLLMLFLLYALAVCGFVAWIMTGSFLALGFLLGIVYTLLVACCRKYAARL